jgi:hypothetical protein
MKLQGLMVAAVVLAALVGALFWSNHHKPADEAEKSANAAPKILTINEADINRIAIKKSTGEITLAKDSAGKWQIVTPQALPADDSAASGLASTLSDLSSERLVEDKAGDLARYGLNQPKLQVTVSSKNKNQTLLIGDDTPTSSGAYAKLDGDPRVFTVAISTKTSLDKSLNDLRDKRLLPVDSDKISQVELIGKQEDIAFGRDKDRWQIVKPKPLRADGSAVDELVNKLSDASMELGSDDDAKKTASAFASGAPVATAKVTTDSGTQELQVRKNKTDYYAKSSAVAGVYKVASDLGEALDKKLDDFRDKNLFDFGYTDPDKIELHDGANAQYITKGGRDWFGGDGKKLDTRSVVAVLGKLRAMQASKFVDSGFTTPEMMIFVTSGGGKNVEKVSISKAGDGYIAKRENDSSLYALPSSTVDDLRKAFADLKPTAATPAVAK